MRGNPLTQQRSIVTPVMTTNIITINSRQNIGISGCSPRRTGGTKNRGHSPHTVLSASQQIRSRRTQHPSPLYNRNNWPPPVEARENKRHKMNKIFFPPHTQHIRNIQQHQPQIPHRYHATLPVPSVSNRLGDQLHNQPNDVIQFRQQHGAPQTLLLRTATGIPYLTLPVLSIRSSNTQPSLTDRSNRDIIPG